MEKDVIDEGTPHAPLQTTIVRLEDVYGRKEA